MNNRQIISSWLLITQENQEIEIKKFIKELAEKENCSEKFLKYIENKSPWAITWLSSNNSYTVEDISIIFEKVQFRLDENQIYFFVIQNAENLSKQTANMLLKCIEEPPTGYKFVLASSSENLIIPTILSRCILIKKENNIKQHPIAILIQDQNCTYEQFIQFIEKNMPSEQIAGKIVEDLYFHYANSCIQQLKTNEITDFLEKQKLLLPMPGSMKNFLKIIYTNIRYIQNRLNYDSK